VADLIDVLRPIPAGLFRDIRTLTLHGAGAREPLKAVLSVVLAVTLADALELDDLALSHCRRKPGTRQASRLGYRARIRLRRSTSVRHIRP
jgi:hypothetical protein